MGISDEFRKDVDEAIRLMDEGNRLMHKINFREKVFGINRLKDRLRTINDRINELGKLLNDE